MSTNDFYGGRWLRVWVIDLETGTEQCPNDAVDVNTISAECRAAIEDRNSGIHWAVVAAAEPAEEESEPILALSRLQKGEASDEDRTLVDSTWNFPIEIETGPQGGAINAERDRRIETGATFSVTGAGDIPLMARPQDQSVYIALLIRAQGAKAMGITAPAMIIRDAQNANHMLTPDQMIELITKAMNWVEAVMKRSWEMKDGLPPFEDGVPENFMDDEFWP